MEKKKIIVLVLSVILIMSLYMTYRTYENKPKELPEENEKIETKKKQFAMYIKDGDNYVEYHGTDENKDLFPEGYKLNTDKSRCEDIDGKEIDDITFNTDTSSITITSNKTSYCYLYFDKVPQTLQTLQSQADSGLSTDLVGGMYRYQGANVNNYICLGKLNDTSCADKSKDMYRIIGITPEGNIKVMKQTSYGQYVWNKGWNDSTCGIGGGCSEWPDSEIYRTLNGSNGFIGTLNSTIKDKIEPQYWWYGDIYDNYTNKTADEIYKIETGEVDSQYYPKKEGGNLETGKWQQMSNRVKIGLIYLHDYYYQSTTSSNCHSAGNNYEACKTGGWMHIIKNGGTTSNNEWTMTRKGRVSITLSYFAAFIIHPYGKIDTGYLDSSFVVRPVFYITNDIEIKGEGTTENPFYIAS